MSPHRRSPLRRLLVWLISPIGLLTMGLFIRLAFIVTMGNRFYFADTAEYEATAMRLLHGLGPGSDTPRAPLFPALMAFGFALGGPHNYVAARLLQLLLAGILLLTAGRVARAIGGGGAERIALFGMVFAPTLVFTTGMLYPTTLYATLLMGITALALAVIEQPTVRRGAALGLCVVLGWLTDQVIIAPVFAVALWLLANGRRHGAAFGRAMAAAAAVFLLVALPYVASQRQAYGGKAVFMQKAQYVLHFARCDSSMDADRHVREVADTTWTPLTTKAFVAHELSILERQPADYLHDVAFEFLHFFKPMPDRVQSKNRYNQSSILLLGAVYFLPVLLLALVGFLSGPGRWRSRLLLGLVTLATAGFYSLFFTQTRYRVPVEPQMIVLAALGLQRMFPRFSATLAGEDPDARPAAGANGGVGR